MTHRQLVGRRPLVAAAGAALPLLMARQALAIRAPVEAAPPGKLLEATRYRFDTHGSSIDTGGAFIGIHAPMAEVMAIIEDFSRYHQILPRLERSRIVGKHAGHTDVYMRAPILRGVAHVWGVARFSPVGRWFGASKKITGRMVKGNIDAWFGAWKITPCGPHRTVLGLEMFIDLIIPVPSSLVTPELSWAADKAVTAVRDIVECGASAVKDG